MMQVRRVRMKIQAYISFKVIPSFSKRNISSKKNNKSSQNYVSFLPCAWFQTSSKAKHVQYISSPTRSSFVRFYIKYAGTLEIEPKKRKRSLTCLQFHATFGTIIRGGILTQIFPTGAAKFRHCYQIWRESQQLWERSLGARYQFLDFPHFYGGEQFLQRRAISTEEANFYGAGQFLRSRVISTEEGNFYGGV